jgi:hypothetical protein
MSESPTSIPAVERAAREALDASLMRLRGEPVGTVAARDVRPEPLNYHHCFTRDFFVSALVFLLTDRAGIVRRFLEVLVELHSRDRSTDCFRPGQGLMPASFIVRRTDAGEALVADFGEHAIARVTPVDSGFWWLLLLRAYTRISGDGELARRPAFQEAIRLIVDVGLEARYQMLPTMLVPDGAFMIDRRMGVYGHPLEIQTLLFVGLRSARELLAPDDPLQEPVARRLEHLLHHVRSYYWVDLARLDRIHRFPVEEYGRGIENHFNIQPDSIPSWLPPWLPDEGGYLVGNLGPGRMDFRFFAQGNLLAVLGALASVEQARAILRLLEQRWDDLVGRMPMKLVFPALEGRDWELVTGMDAKNRPWSYHNGGSWPCLLWALTAAAQRAGRQDLAHAALEIAARRIAVDDWPEYYDTPAGRLVGRQARRKQTWTAAGFLAALELLRDGRGLEMLAFEDDIDPSSCAQADPLATREDPTEGE